MQLIAVWHHCSFVVFPSTLCPVYVPLLPHISLSPRTLFKSLPPRRRSNCIFAPIPVFPERRYRGTYGTVEHPIVCS